MRKMSIDKEYTYTVTEIQRFCMHDGPGVRTTVFFKGCPLRCKWCHNPETQSPKSELLFYGNKCVGCGACTDKCEKGAHIFEPYHTVDRNSCQGCGKCAEVCPGGALELCGREMTDEEIIAAAQRDRAFYGDSGGITLSGGEPLARAGIASLLRKCKERGLTTAIETCGFVKTEAILEAAPYTDIFLYDLKDTDSMRHKVNTGADLDKIIRNLRAIDDCGAKIRLRCILIRGVNTDSVHYGKIAEMAKSLNWLEAAELIPYHPYGGAKSLALGKEDCSDKSLIPEKEEIYKAAEIIKSFGVKVL